MPGAAVGRVQQAAGAVGGLVRRAVEVRAVAAGFAVQQPARGVVPGRQLVVEQHMAMARGGQAVLVRGAAQRRGRAQARLVGGDLFAQAVGQVGGGDHAVHLIGRGRAGYVQRLLRAVLVVDPGAFAAHGQRRVVADGVVDHAGQHVAAMAHGDHHAEQGQAGHVVAGAVDGVDEKGQVGIDQHVEQRRVARRGFLADQHRARIQLAQARGDMALGLFVGDGDQIARRTLAAHRVLGQVAKARQDFGTGGFGKQGGDAARFVARECPVHGMGEQCTTRKSSMGRRAGL
ncbi:Uncharacterised protein [Bordetella pertussis]|nr:Uncharacterised protein [Bordetella pertussis]CFP00263.1 Uncharacterised protein [Bordetella pertussis]CFW56613.1 Uncharacterised protein [Bordetella pertussis]CPK23651.1 Uncharacterised protein [Bordetella pertussis]